MIIYFKNKMGPLNTGEIGLVFLAASAVLGLPFIIRKLQNKGYVKKESIATAAYHEIGTKNLNVGLFNYGKNSSEYSPREKFLVIHEGKENETVLVYKDNQMLSATLKQSSDKYDIWIRSSTSHLSYQSFFKKFI